MAAENSQSPKSTPGPSDDNGAPTAPGSAANEEADITGHHDDSTVSAACLAPAPLKAAGTVSERQPTFKDFLRVFSYANKVDWFLMVAACVSSIGSGITLPLMNVVFGKLVGNFSTSPRDSSDAESFQNGLNRQSLYIFILFLARFILNYINKFSFRMISARMSAAIRLDYLCCLFGQTIHVLDSMPSGAAANTITTTANTLQLGISENLGTFIEFAACILASIIVAFTYSWLLTLVISSVLVYILVVVSIVLPYVVKSEASLTRAETVANSIASESFGNIRMLMACGAEDKMARKYGEWVQVARKHGQHMAPFLASMFGNVFFSLYGGFALAFWFGMRLFREGRIHDVGTVIVVVMSVITTIVSMERVATPLIAASKAMVAAGEFFAVIDAPRAVSGRLAEPDVFATEDIVFSDVDFAYPGRPHVKVLDGLNIRIAAGKVNAIVGPSGSGKSTIIGLIERWYSLRNDQHVIEKVAQKDKKKEAEEKELENQVKKDAKNKKKQREEKCNATTDTNNKSGRSVGDAKTDPVAADLPRIELKGSVSTCAHSLDEIDVKWWRSQIGLVQQEPFLFNDSIFNNVAFGLVGSPYENATDDEKRALVEESCKEAFADEFINRLPERYQTRVGESGAKLSGGQRQRIAIARSIVKKPKILILDEATSAIDVRSERVVQAALDKVSRNRTTITVAHRLSTIKSADKIIVLQKGQCVEEGTHERLLENQNGVYHRLVTAQQLSLGDDIATTKKEITVSDGDDTGAVVNDKHGHAGGDETAASDNSNDILDSADNAPPVGAVGPLGAAWRDTNFFGSFGRLLYEQRSGFPYYAALVLFAAGAASSSPLQAFLFAKLVVIFGELNLIVDGNTGLTMDQVSHDGNFNSLMFFVLAIGTGVAYFGLGFVATFVEHFICAIYREQYFVSIVQQRIAFFDNEKNASGTLTNHVGGDPKQLRQLLGGNMSMAATSVFTIVGSLIISFVFGWKLALLAFAVVVPLVLISGFYRVRYEIEFESMNAAVFAESSKWAAESIDAFRTVTALTLEEVICKRPLFSGMVAISYRLGAESAGQGLSFLPNAAQVTSAANRILGIRETKSVDQVPLTERLPDTDAADDARIGNRGACLELRNVHFRYPTRNVPIFSGLNLTIERGKFTAIVGASGSGKTSIIALLERFYDVEKGGVFCNGRDITEVNVQTYRKLLSLVAQEPALFQGTVRENVLLGVEENAVSEADIVQACRDASIHDFIVSLPDGYNTDLGSKAISLSGGQKQRVAIARALLRNPRVLLLDEATSSLDSDTEKTIQATFERIAQGRTTVAVAHRLSTIQKADVIYVLGDGEVLETGNHSSLLSKRVTRIHNVVMAAKDNAKRKLSLTVRCITATHEPC
ncbi:hypothetical protein HMPREF1624_01094 [Sporothrix schenckii ATCC 58251]|uniref:Uncharacterized protein n=1 Tax=Sporothrix schenckii (strain ATCC 58251 / de Perez 2211183) TaxID=1391915 RepID=U7Q6G1_SPOS1|nr:hypothetical protein HMPREF1624_01094 [Sporothrix schenckii ATCC 58251]